MFSLSFHIFTHTVCDIYRIAYTVWKVKRNLIKKIKTGPLDQLLICNAKKCHMKTVFLFSCDSHILFFIILCDLRRFIYYFSSFTCAFSFCAASFGCSAFMIADTTAIPSMFPPFSTSIFPSFSPPIATAGIGTA